MRPQTVVVAASFLSLMCWACTEASTLEEKKFEWAFELSAASVENEGDFSEFGFRWGALLGKGYHEVGAFISAFSNDYDFPLMRDETGSTIGPFYILHFTPGKIWGSGFLFVAIGYLDGDLGNVYEYSTELGVGIKATVGNSAAISVIIERVQLWTDGLRGDRESTAIGVALSIFTHSR